MPIFQLFTTVAATDVPSDFAPKVAQLLSRLVDKPIERIVVHVFSGQTIYAGNDPEGNEQNAYAVLRSIGRLGADENRNTIAELTKFVKTELGIDSHQFRLFFIDANPNMTGTLGKIAYDLVAATDIPSDFAPKVAQLLSRVLTKPIERIVVHVFSGQTIYAANDPDGNEQNAYGEIRAIGHMSADENRNTIAELTKLVKTELGIDSHQFRLFFIDMNPNMTGTLGKIAYDLGIVN